MKYLAAIALTFTIISSSVSAAKDTGLEIAINLGSVLGSETACGLEYDENAIQAFIVKHVDADDMSFAPTLETQTGGWKRLTEKMSASLLAAHRTQIRRVAKQYGFTK
jgi:hypothetical protein